MPNPACQVKENAGAYVSTSGGVDVTPASTVTINLIDTSADSWSIECVYTDDTSVAATVTSSLSINTNLRTATFTAPAAGKTYIFRSKVNNGVGPDGKVKSSYSTTFGIYTLTADNRRVIAANETTEGGPFGWIEPVNDLIRNPSPGGGAGTPPGSDTQGIFNDGGAFGADAGWTYNKTTNRHLCSGGFSAGADPALSDIGLSEDGFIWWKQGGSEHPGIGVTAAGVLEIGATTGIPIFIGSGLNQYITVEATEWAFDVTVLKLGPAASNRTFSWGTGAPASSPADGSLYLRTDGTAATGIYTRQAGAWEAVGGTSGLSIAGVCTLEQFGAVGDGVTDDSAAVTAALAAISAGTYKAILLGASRTYLISGIAAVAGMAIIGHGQTSVLKTTSNAAVVDITVEDVVLSNFKILGNDTGASQHGVKLGTDGAAGSGPQRARISNVWAEDCGGRGFLYVRNVLTTSTGPRFEGCVAKSCATGFYFAESGEYAIATGCDAYTCTIGVDVGAGNLTWMGGNISRNGTGVKLTAGTNDSHGMFVGTNINHNTSYNVDGGAIANGHTFSACHLYEGPIRLVSSTGVQFVGCEIDVTAYTLTSAVGTRFDSCIFPESNANTITESGGATTYWTNSRKPNGTIPTFLSGRSVHVDNDGSNCYIGTDRAESGGAASMRIGSTTDGYLRVAGNGVMYWDANTIRSVKPRIGLISPYAVDGVGEQAMGDANQAPANTVYCFGTIRTTGALTANRNLTLPAATDAAAYEKTIANTCSGAFSVVVTTGAGTTVTIANTKTAKIRVDAGGVSRVTADA